MKWKNFKRQALKLEISLESYYVEIEVSIISFIPAWDTQDTAFLKKEVFTHQHIEGPNSKKKLGILDEIPEQCYKIFLYS